MHLSIMIGKNNKIYLFIILSLLSFWSMACDVCSVYEYGHIQNRSYAGVFYRYRAMNGYNTGTDPSSLFPQNSMRLGHLYDLNDRLIHVKNEKDYELFETYEIRYNHNFNDKANLMILLPYNISTSYYHELYTLMGDRKDTTEIEQGIGDLTIILEKLYIKEKTDYSHFIKLGGGLRMPTGKFSLVTKDGSPADPAHQPGNGAYDFMIRSSYIGTFNKKYGIIAYANYMLSTRSKSKDLVLNSRQEISNYRFANRFNTSTNVFYIIGSGDFRIIPQTGLYYEQAKQDVLNMRLRENTGGKNLFGQFGLDFNYKAFTFQTMYQMPFYQALNGSQLINAGRINVGLIYNIVKKTSE